jgi:hypothetical protein
MALAEKVGSGMQRIPAHVDTAREDLRRRFLDDPYGAHDEELALVLGAMRSDPRLPRLVLVAAGAGRWLIGVVDPARGESLTAASAQAFTDRAAAERFAFDLRWSWLAERNADA